MVQYKNNNVNANDDNNLIFIINKCNINGDQFFGTGIILLNNLISFNSY